MPELIKYVGNVVMQGYGNARYTTASFLIYCPGCQELHFIENYETNGDQEDPEEVGGDSIITRDNAGNIKCHFWLRRGEMEFLSDSTHHLRQREVRIPPIKQHLGVKGKTAPAPLLDIPTEQERFKKLLEANLKKLTNAPKK